MNFSLLHNVAKSIIKDIIKIHQNHLLKSIFIENTKKLICKNINKENNTKKFFWNNVNKKQK
jgi:hypothetical protein